MAERPGESESDSPASTSTTASCERDGTVVESPPSILSVLRAPKLSDLARKRKVPSNPPHDGKRYKSPSCASEPKSVTPAMRVKSFPGEWLLVSGGKFFCSGCREELSVKSNMVKLHLQSTIHKDGKVRLLQKEKHMSRILRKQYDNTMQIIIQKGKRYPSKKGSAKASPNLLVPSKIT